MTAIMEPPVSLEGMSEEEKDRLLAALMAERAEPAMLPEPVREAGIGPYPTTGSVIVYKGSVGSMLGDAGTMGSGGLSGRWLGGF